MNRSVPSEASNGREKISWMKEGEKGGGRGTSKCVVEIIIVNVKVAGGNAHDIPQDGANGTGKKNNIMRVLIF